MSRYRISKDGPSPGQKYYTVTEKTPVATSEEVNAVDGLQGLVAMDSVGMATGDHQAAQSAEDIVIATQAAHDAVLEMEKNVELVAMDTMHVSGADAVATGNEVAQATGSIIDASNLVVEGGQATVTGDVGGGNMVDLCFYSCSECDFLTANYEELTSHMVLHRGLRLYQCPHCGHSSQNLASVEQHVIAEHGDSGSLHINEISMSLDTEGLNSDNGVISTGTEIADTSGGLNATQVVTQGETRVVVPAEQIQTELNLVENQNIELPTDEAPVT